MPEAPAIATERLADFEAALRARVQGDFRTDDLHRALYATDASMYRIPPVGVLNPVVGCRWEPPSGAADDGRDNVVMNPVVANLTDGNGDGVTNTLDIPALA